MYSTNSKSHNTRRIACAFALIALVCSPVLSQTPAFSLVESADAVAIKAPGYEMTIARDGFAYQVRRGDELVLQTAQGSDAATNMGFARNGKPQRVTKLRAIERLTDGVALLYDTTDGGSAARIELRPEADRVRVKSWMLGDNHQPATTARFRLDVSGAWYGGGFQGWREPQTFPLNRARIARAFLADGATQGTPAWYATKGVGVWVRSPHDFRYSLNATHEGKTDGLLSVEMERGSSLAYDILIDRDLRSVIRRVVREIGYPRTVPPAEYFRDPIYTTWVEYKDKALGTFVSQAKVEEFARKIREHRLPAGVIEIDDKWESAYGDLEFDPKLFPDPKRMVDELHRQGFKVTLWMHPFVNVESKAYKDANVRRLLLNDATGEPGVIKWWQGTGAIYDFTNPAAGAEFRRRMRTLQERYGIDGFKFDAGDVPNLPRDMRPQKQITPAEFADIYNRETAAHFPLNEVRVGVYSQPLGIVQRLIDKHSVWGTENGLGAIIPEALNSSLRGYQYVMPDMIGGNQYDGDTIDKELLIRWAQASALMPFMQFSRAPWNFDEETIRLSREASEMHVRFAGLIFKLAQAAPRTGEPIIAPLWYHAPEEPETYQVTDQFMLGTDVVVAPVITKGATRRDVYLPAGRWRDLKTNKMVEGKRLVRDHPAPLDTLPVFVREGFAL